MLNSDIDRENIDFVLIEFGVQPHRGSLKTARSIASLTAAGGPGGERLIDARRRVTAGRRGAARGLFALGSPILRILLEVISSCRANRRETPPREFLLVQRLGTGGTLRAEEVMPSVPDGRSVRTWVNAKPLRAGGRAAWLEVATIHDLAVRGNTTSRTAVAIRPGPNRQGRSATPRLPCHGAGLSSWSYSTRS